MKVSREVRNPEEGGSRWSNDHEFTPGLQVRVNLRGPKARKRKWARKVAREAGVPLKAYLRGVVQ